MSIFFASMAQNFSERASHAVSRGSVAALIPHEKSAKLIQPLKENTDKSARNYTGADRKVERSTHSPLSVLKNDSIAALSYQSPVRLILTSIPSSFSRERWA